MYICNLFAQGAPRSSQEPFLKCLCILGLKGNVEMLVFEERGNWNTQRKTSRTREENQQQTQPTYDARSGDQI